VGVVGYSRAYEAFQKYGNEVRVEVAVEDLNTIDENEDPKVSEPQKLIPKYSKRKALFD